MKVRVLAPNVNTTCSVCGKTKKDGEKIRVLEFQVGPGLSVLKARCYPCSEGDLATSGKD